MQINQLNEVNVLEMDPGPLRKSRGTSRTARYDATRCDEVMLETVRHLIKYVTETTFGEN